MGWALLRSLHNKRYVFNQGGRMKYSSLYFSLLFLSSCALNYQSYSEPKVGPLSTIEFVNSGTGSGSVSIFKEHSTCKGRELSEAIASGSRSYIKVKGDSMFSFAFGYKANEKQYCRIFGTFLPITDKTYYVEVRPEQGGCALKLKEKSSDDTFLEVASFKKRIPKKDVWDENSSFCE